MIELLGSYVLLIIGVVLIFLLLLLINYRSKANAKKQRVLLEASLAELQKQTQILQKMLNESSQKFTDDEHHAVSENRENPYPQFIAER